MTEMTKYAIYKRNVSILAIKDAAKVCKGNFEIPFIAIRIVESGNRMRVRPIRVSYNYMYDLMHEMLSAGVI